MTAADLPRTATTPDDDEPNGLSQAAIEASLEARIVRLEQFTSGLAVILDRFRGRRGSGTTTVFDDFDDPSAGNEALDVLFAACSNARRDLTALRRELAALNGAPDRGSELAVVTRLRLLDASATELAARFEDHRRSRDVTLPPRSPGGVVRLDEFVGMVVRALRDIAEAAEGLRRRPAQVEIAAVVAAPQPIAPRPIAPQPSAPRPAARPRRSVVAVATPAAGALWHVLRRRRTRLLIELAGVLVVGLVVLFSALNRGEQAPGSIAGLQSPSATLARTGDTGVAVGGSSPSSLPSPLPSPGPVTPGPTPVGPPAPGPSKGAPAPNPPPATPSPTRRPAPTPTPPIAVTRFNDRIVAAADSIDGLLASITTAVHDADLATAKAGADEIGSIASAERTWLLAHPAHACYESLQESAFATYGDLISTAAAIAADADAGDGNAIHKKVASGHGDVSALRQAGTKAITACA